MSVTRRRRKAALVALLLGLLAVAVWFLTSQALAWRHFRAGSRALERDEPEEARRHLQACVRVWRTSGEAHFLLARAARRCGELGEASRHLDDAARHGWVAEMIALERALLLVQAGEAGPDVEKYLQASLTAGHPDAAAILEVLTPLYLRHFRLEQAEACVNRWLELQPERAAAWNSRAVLAVRRRNREEAIRAYSEEVRLAPGRHASRLELARLLLDRQRPADAAQHLDILAKALPRDADVLAELARLRDREGQRDEAARLLDKALSFDPSLVPALHLRGKLALDAGKPLEAEPFLRRAAELAAFEPYVLYTWLRCLQQRGKTDEARAVQERHRRAEADLKRVSQLASYIASQPDRPDPRREMAAIYFRNGQEEQGLRWLQTALRVAPDDPLTHHAFALYYEGKGLYQLAAPHRARSGKPAPSLP